MKINFNDIYRRIEEIIKTYNPYNKKNIKFNQNNAFEKTYANEVQNCLNEKISFVKNTYITLEKEIKSAVTQITEYLNNVVIYKEILKKMEYYKESLDFINGKISELYTKKENLENSLNSIEQEMDNFKKTNVCERNLKLVNTINDKNVKKYIDSINLIADYDREYVIKERFEKKVDYLIEHDPNIIEKKEKLEIQKAKTLIKLNKMNQQIYAYKNLVKVCLQEKNKTFDDISKIKEILVIKEENIENKFKKYNVKTIDIIYQSIIIATKEDYTYYNTNIESKVFLTLKWLRSIKYGGSN